MRFVFVVAFGAVTRLRAQSQPSADTIGASWEYDSQLVRYRVEVVAAGVRVPFDEIDYVTADGDYVRVFAGKRQWLLRLTMNRIEAALPAHGHVRIHRSAIVNVTRVRTLEALPNAELSVVLRSGVALRASRSYVDRLRLALGVISASECDERMK